MFDDLIKTSSFSITSDDFLLKIGLGIGAIVQLIFIISLIACPQTESLDDLHDTDDQQQSTDNMNEISTKTDFYNLIHSFKKNKKNKDKKKRK